MNDIIHIELDELKQSILNLRDKVKALETLLQIANLINDGVAAKKRLWSIESPFQKNIEEYIGKPPYE